MVSSGESMTSQERREDNQIMLDFEWALVCLKEKEPCYVFICVQNKNGMCSTNPCPCIKKTVEMYGLNPMVTGT
jgi:hypothetical protein